MVKRLKEVKSFKDMSPTGINKYLMKSNPMKKTIMHNVRYLEGLARKSKEKVSDKISHLIELYKTRKNPQMTTVEKLILSLRSPSQRLVSKASKQYDALAAKYEDAEPLPEKHQRLRKEKAEIKVAQNRASTKITNMFRNALKIYIAKKEAAMNENVLDYTVQYGYTGTVTKYDLTSIWYRSFHLVKKELASKQKLKL
jgi:hypothetical protein